MKPHNEMDVMEKAPKFPENVHDRFQIMTMFLFILGLVHFLPWTFFTTATEYWMYKFRNTSLNTTDSELRTPLQAEFNVSLQVALQSSDVLFLFLATIYGHKMTVKARLNMILWTFLGLFAAIAVCTKINTDSWQTVFFGLTMALVAGIDAMNSLFSVTMYTLMSNFPPQYLAPYIAGGGLSKIFTATLQLFSLTFGLSIQSSALIYFSMGVAVMIISVISTILVTNYNHFYLVHMRNFKEGQRSESANFQEMKDMLKVIWPCICIMGLYLLGVNASPTTLVVSEGEGSGKWSDIFFVPTITFLLGAVGNLTGRGISFVVNIKFSTVWGVILAVIRCCFFVTVIMFCNAQPRHHLPVVFKHDYQYTIITILESFTGGFLMSVCILDIPKLVPQEKLQIAYHVFLIGGGFLLAMVSSVGLFTVRLL